MEPNQIDIFTLTVLRNLEQIDDTKETRFASQLWSDIRKTDRLDRIHFDRTFLHAVPGAHFDMRTRPYSDTASDFSATNSIAQSLGEYHEEILHAAEAGVDRIRARGTPWSASHMERTGVLRPSGQRFGTESNA